MQYKFSELIDHIENRLKTTSKKTINNNSLRSSGVLIPFFKKNDQPYLLLTKRSEKLRYHKGQISFPGGVYEKTDKDLEDTALRETFEEVGIIPKHVKVIGETNDMATPSKFKISPFVGVFDYPYDFKVCEDEISELIEIPFYHFTNPNTLRVEEREYNGDKFPVYFYDYHEYTVWGVTGKIIYDFVQIIS